MKNLDFETGFKYPFKRPKGLLNIFWVLIPVIGWFVYFGYVITIIKHFIKGDYKGLPKLNFERDIGLGFFMFLKGIPFMAVYIVVYIALLSVPVAGIIGNLFIAVFAFPMLFMNFIKKETAGSFFEFSKVRGVLDNFGEYVMVLLRSIFLQVVFLIMSIILVGIPAGSFTKNIFFANFYGKYCK